VEQLSLPKLEAGSDLAGPPAGKAEPEEEEAAEEGAEDGGRKGAEEGAGAMSPQPAKCGGC